MVEKPVEALPRGLRDSAVDGNGSGDAAAGMESILAEVLADVVSAEQVSVDGHFFEELGADSLVMAHFCARVRKRADLPSVSMKDVYRHPTIRSLATALADAAPLSPAAAPSASPAGPSAHVSVQGSAVPAQASAVPDQAPEPAPPPTGRPRYVLCGALQFLMFLGSAYLIAFVSVQGYEWISAGSGLRGEYLRSVVFGGAVFLGLCVLPVLLKWTLIGRWKPTEIRVWSLAYVRFWVVKTLIRSNPLVLFVGSPLYLLYLRALGARVGRGAVVFSRNVPVCTDLLTIGDGTLIRKDSFFSCYRAHAGLIQTGPVTFGKNVLVSEATVIDIDTSLGDDAQLGHASSLHRGQAVPAGEHWHGSPALQTDVDFQVVGPARCGPLRRTVHSVLQLLTALLLYLPLAVGGLSVLLTEIPHPHVLDPGSAAVGSWAFYIDALVVSAVLVFGAVPAGILLLVTVPRLLALGLAPDRVYCLYGFRYGAHRTIAILTNWKLLKRLFGDSSAIVHYLRGLGYDLSRVVQTGSNFGTLFKHETPFLTSVGSGTMIADGLSVMNAEFSSTGFRLSRTSIGPRNFLGNNIVYPARGRTGDNCLLATKVMVPVDGEVREGVGLLGSPSFEIPRSVLRDREFDRFTSGDELRRGLAAKNRHNVATMGWFLLSRWGHVFGVTLLAWAAVDFYGMFGTPAIALANVLVMAFTVVYFVLAERVVTALHPLQPLFCSIYDARFWRRERYWKVSAERFVRMFNGTPFKSLLWRMVGVRIGSKVFDDGCAVVDRPLTAIGDGCTLNLGSTIQSHSQEDGAFKSDRSTIGSGCTIGVGALVHYGVTVGDGAVLAPDSFLMKGETVPDHAWWGGNPARQLAREGIGEGRRDG